MDKSHIALYQASAVVPEIFRKFDVLVKDTTAQSTSYLILYVLKNNIDENILKVAFLDELRSKEVAQF